MVAHHRVIVAALSLLAVLHSISAKRGCSAFGHSCFGGHGKRSNDFSSPDIPKSESLAQGQEEIPPHPGYPALALARGSPPLSDVIPIRAGGFYDRDDGNVEREYLKIQLRNIVKHWMDSYRRSQDSADEYGNQV